MNEQQPNLTREELKLLIEAGDITFDNIGKIGLTKEETKAALTEIMVSQKGPLGKVGIPTLPGAGTITGGFKKGYDAARASGKTFGSVEKVSQNVSKATPQSAIQSNAVEDIRKVLFGGLNSAKSSYPAIRRGPLEKADISQMVRNIKEVAKSGASGVVRRKP